MSLTPGVGLAQDWGRDPVDPMAGSRWEDTCVSVCLLFNQVAGKAREHRL